MSTRDTWEDVAALRKSAENYALLNDTLAAALMDCQASAMRDRLLAAEKAAKAAKEQP